MVIGKDVETVCLIYMFSLPEWSIHLVCFVLEQIGISLHVLMYKEIVETETQTSITV